MKTSCKNVVLSALAAVMLLLFGGQVARAQPASALGKPLPLSSLPPGTVSVRLIAGATSEPVIGAEVTLSVNGSPLAARTDDTGRAMFPGVAVGATVIASARADDADGAEAAPTTSESFTVPGDTGVAVMLSTKPMTDSGAPAGGGPMMNGGAMPEPRLASGQAQAFPGDGPGSLAVVVTYNDMKDPSPPTQHPVVLVGYHANEQVVVFRGLTDAKGVAHFNKLDVSGSTAYYAMTLLPRDGVVDRVVSQPLIFGEVGLRVLLSTVKKGTAAAPIDDANRLDDPMVGAPVGQISAELFTATADSGTSIELVNAQTGAVVASKPVPATGSSGRRLLAMFSPLTPDPQLGAGTLDLRVLAGGPDDGQPLPNVVVRLEPELDAAGTTNGRTPIQVNTGTDGIAHFGGVAAGRWLVRVASAGSDGAESPPLVIGADMGGHMEVLLRMQEGIPSRAASFPVDAGSDGQAFYLQARVNGVLVRSVPLLASIGLATSATLEAYPSLLFQFELNGGVDDKFLGIQGQFAIYNRLPRPYLDTVDGMLIPLPHGFTGAVVADEDQALVSPERGDPGGFRIRRAIPPRGMAFRGGFSLTVDSGEIKWDYDLPFGAVESRLAMVENPGMKVDLPPGVTGEHRTTEAGLAFFRIADISIPPGQRMSLLITGLPAQPAWKIWMPRIVGLLALAFLGIGLGLAISGTRKRANDAKGVRKERIAALMDQLVDVERRGDDPDRRAALVAELEALWPTKATDSSSAADQS